MKREEIIKALRCCWIRPDLRDCEEKCPYFCGANLSRCIPNMTSDAAAMLESDAAEIAALKAENERIRQKYISPEQVKAQKWISVKDGLPVRPEDTFHDGHWWMTSGEDFIVSDSDGKVFEAHWTYGCSCQNYFWYENSLIPLTNITHWMPLPEPPKEAQHDN